ncbi:MAG: hypothetical protein RL264_165 [Bacteroidota bacterium]|jgi:hypothetical protein
MNTIFGAAGLELVLSVLIGVITVLVSKTVLVWFYKRQTNDANPYDNLSFMIYLSGMIFSISFITYGIMEPLTATFKILEDSGENGIDLITQGIQYAGFFLMLSYSFSVLVIFISYKLFTALTTNINEYEEIKANNIGIAILVVVLTIVTAMFVKTPFIAYLDSFIPYPELPRIN